MIVPAPATRRHRLLLGVLGLLISALTLHETVTTPLVAGIILVAAGIRLAVTDAPRMPSRAAPALDSAARLPGG